MTSTRPSRRWTITSLAGLTSDVRGVFERVAELPEPFDVHSSSAK
jgi:hypothetical protein